MSNSPMNRTRSTAGFRYGLASLVVVMTAACLIAAWVSRLYTARYDLARKYEAELEQKILALDLVPGMRVAVAAELDENLTPSLARAVVTVPSRAYKERWLAQQAESAASESTDGSALAPTAADLLSMKEEVRCDIQNAIVGLLPPVPQDVDRFPLVEVITREE